MGRHPDWLGPDVNLATYPDFTLMPFSGKRICRLGNFVIEGFDYRTWWHCYATSFSDKTYCLDLGFISWQDVPTHLSLELL